MAEREKEGEAEEKDTFGLKRNAKYRLELKSRENTAKSQKKFDKDLEKAEKEAMVDKVAFGQGLKLPICFCFNFYRLEKVLF